MYFVTYSLLAISIAVGAVILASWLTGDAVDAKKPADADDSQAIDDLIMQVIERDRIIDDLKKSLAELERKLAYANPEREREIEMRARFEERCA